MTEAEKLIRKLKRRGALKRLETGDDGVKVSLMYEPRPEGDTRAERRKFLEGQFRAIAQDEIEAEVELDSVSVTGQTVSATLPVGKFESLCRRLRERHIRVDVLIDRQVV